MCGGGGHQQHKSTAGAEKRQGTPEMHRELRDSQADSELGGFVSVLKFSLSLLWRSLKSGSLHSVGPKAVGENPPSLLASGGSKMVLALWLQKLLSLPLSLTWAFSFSVNKALDVGPTQVIQRVISSVSGSMTESHLKRPLWHAKQYVHRLGD